MMKVKLKRSFINFTQEDYRQKSGVPYWKFILIQERKKLYTVYMLECQQGDEICFRYNKIR